MPVLVPVAVPVPVLWRCRLRCVWRFASGAGAVMISVWDVLCATCFMPPYVPRDKVSARLVAVQRSVFGDAVGLCLLAMVPFRVIPYHSSGSLDGVSRETPSRPLRLHSRLIALVLCGVPRWL